MKRLMVREKAFYGMLLAIAMPIALQNLINFAINMADTVMLGMLGELHLSASTLANQAGFIFMLFVFGMGSGANVMTAQYYGKGDIESIHRVMAVMYRVLLLGAVFFTLMTQLFPGKIMSIFSKDADVIREGTRFLRIVGLSYLPSGISGVTMIAQRAVGNVRISIVVYLVSLLVNVGGNWLLIFGNMGAPALGIEGAAIATVFARVVEMTIALIYLFRFERKLRFRPADLLRPVSPVLPEYARTAVPVAFNEVLWGAGVSMIAMIIGRLGTPATAAYSITAVIGQLVTITVMGVGNAAGVVIGNTIGAGKYQKAREYSDTLLVLAALLGLAAGCVVLLIKAPVVGLYNISDLARRYANQMLIVYSVAVIFKSLASVSLIGVLRGGGDARFVLFLDVFFLWTISIPLAFLAGHVWGAPVWAVYLIIQCDDIIKAVSGIVRIQRGKWINDITI